MHSVDPDAVAQPFAVEEEKGLSIDSSKVPPISAEDEIELSKWKVWGMVDCWRHHNNNALAHTAFTVTACLSWIGIAMLPQPPYSPDLRSTENSRDALFQTYSCHRMGCYRIFGRGQLTWLVYIIAAAIGGRVSFNTADEYDAMDGELICRVLQLMNLTDNRISQNGCEKLELAMIFFFQQFRKIYVGDQIQRASKVYKRLSEVLGVADESMVLSVFVRKILTNLKYWSRSEQIINRTLQLLSDLSVGYTSVRKLVKLDEVQFMLNNHTSEHFPFLGSAMQLNDMRCRSVFYTALGRLLLINLGEDEERFEQFMLPLTTTFEAVGNSLSAAESGVFDESETKKQLIGLARDLRGLAFAFNTKISYMMLFEWIYPAYTPILHRAIEMWYHDPAVTTPVLKLFAELVVNRSQRLQFDVSSPNGVLLFREASKVIVNYGTRLLTMTNIQKDQVYKMKYPFFHFE
ncbi:exportin-7 [Trichonephila inaurata madagascariensis]|uniref:Exportin-7 n=1 Tax=Trichonephila inaurata madagascariensis TaxID=2747483 RepID=A0A8X6X9V1_9ARAC|nr:exportin-7 [Trichonephila inaurata madagascariensis]